MATEKYPIDIDELSKGTVIPRARIEHIYGADRDADEPNYRRKMMALQSFIHDNTPYTVKCEGDDLRILEDEEASAYLERQDRNTVRKLGRLHERNMLVDVQNLSKERLPLHERTLIKQSRGLAALKTARRLPRPKPSERKTPPLIPPTTGSDSSE